MASAGRVAIVPKGDYNSSTTYKKLDLVRYNNNGYIAKKANTGVLPADETTWMLSIENLSQAKYDELISGTTPAGNSNLLQGLTAEEVGESGARNLIPYPYVNSTRTVEGIDWTDNGDGTLTANGTAGNTSHSIFNVRVRSGSNDPNPLILKADTYTYTGTPKGGSTSTYCTQIGHTVDGAFKAIGYDTGDGFTFTLTEDVQIQIQPLVAKNQPVNNLTFRPMLELGSVAHDYVPYHFGGAENSLKLNGLTAEEFVSNENLLVNPYFKNPVNTSGVTSWTPKAYGEIIDSWFLGSQFNASLVDGGLQIAPQAKLTENVIALTQYVDFAQENCEVTYSIKVNVTNAKTFIRMYAHDESNVQISYSNKVAVIDGIATVTFTTPENISKVRLTMSMDSGVTASDIVCIEWIKLEIGKLATPFIPPNKEVEKLKCGIVDMPVNKTSTDLDQEFYLTNGVTITKYTGATLNTPYTQGLTYTANGKCITSSSGSTTTYAIQLVLPNGANTVYVRKMTNGKIGKWANIADGGNADTLDGLHADDFLSSDGGTLTGTEVFFYNGYGRIASTDKLIQLESRNEIGDTNNRRFLGIQNSVQKEDVKNALVFSDIVDGEQKTYIVMTTANIADYAVTPTGTAAKATADANGKNIADTYLTKTGTAAKATADANGKNIASTYKTKAESVNVKISTSAPSDTSAVWVDTANKVTKIYKDGAWTALALA